MNFIHSKLREMLLLLFQQRGYLYPMEYCTVLHGPQNISLSSTPEYQTGRFSITFPLQKENVQAGPLLQNLYQIGVDSLLQLISVLWLFSLHKKEISGDRETQGTRQSVPPALCHTRCFKLLKYLYLQDHSGTLSGPIMVYWRVTPFWEHQEPQSVPAVSDSHITQGPENSCPGRGHVGGC